MNDNCCTPSLTDNAVRSQPAACPTNGKVGRPVHLQTLKAQLSVPLTRLRSADYRFCPAADCPTVYYSTDGQICFGLADLREDVFQKHSDLDSTLVCYCFQHTVGSIHTEIERTGVSTVIDQITAGIQAGYCACDIRNPQGTCCLGNVRRLVQRIQSRTIDETDTEVSND